MVVNESNAKAFYSPAVSTAVVQAMCKSLTKPHGVLVVATSTKDVPVFTVPVASFTNREADKGLFEKAKMEKRFAKLVVAVYEKNTTVEEEIPIMKMDSVRAPAPPRRINLTTKTHQSEAVLYSIILGGVGYPPLPNLSPRREKQELS